MTARMQRASRLWPVPIEIFQCWNGVTDLLTDLATSRQMGKRTFSPCHQHEVKEKFQVH